MDTVGETIHANELQVTVMDLEKILYQGVARSISSVNDTGPFDILPLHSNFISLIQKKVDIRDGEGHRKTFSIVKGVLICRKNTVHVYLGL